MESFDFEQFLKATLGFVSTVAAIIVLVALLSAAYNTLSANNGVEDSVDAIWQMRQEMCVESGLLCEQAATNTNSLVEIITKGNK